ncbi:Pre-rRNA-processing protein ipi3 [Coemansia sp. RSA 1933]|nr:Pre-rRNA-processing protein ipi3 [Coemansia sp. RSA 1933]
MFTEIVAAGTKTGVQVYDLRRGTKLAQGLGVSVGRYGFDLCDSWIAAVDEKKPLCHIYMLNRGDTSQKFTFPFPEEIACVHVLDKGAYLAAGAKSGRIIVWATASGRLLRSWDAHYGAVTSLSSSKDVLVSGGEDAAVHIWMLSQALDHFSTRNSTVTPVVSLTDHTLAITALRLAHSGILSGRGRIYTASKDHTCKQWRVRIEHDGESYTGRAELLATLLYPGTVNDIAIDAVDTRVFAATAAGLFQTNLFAYRKPSIEGSTIEHAKAQPVALGGTSDTVISEHCDRYPTTDKSIAALCLNFDGSLLVSASEAGDIRVWDTASRQCLRTINDKQLSAGVAQLSSRLAPPQLGGPRSSVGVGLLRPEIIAEQPVPHKISSISFTPLQRLAQEGGSKTSTAFEASVKQRLSDVTRDMARFEGTLNVPVPYGQTSRADAAVLESLWHGNESSERQVVELLQQVERLQKHHAITRRLNDEMYQSAVTEWLGSRQKN